MAITRIAGPDLAPPLHCDEAQRKAAEAALRALPLQRLTGNGMDFADAASLHRMAGQGVLWTEAAAHLGELNLERARAAQHEGRLASARSFYRFAAACFRFGQSTLFFDDAQKVGLYRRALETFAAAAALDEPVTEKHSFAVEGGTVSGWLVRPSDRGSEAVVLIFGGADGWREEYHAGANYLAQRGVAALLIDGPGQGETRLIGRFYLRQPPERIYAAVAEELRARRLAARIGIWGNSLGGNFAARAAALGTFDACCVNGGAAQPSEAVARFPRFVDRICAMRGDDDQDAARMLFEALALGSAARDIRCPLLLLHGGEDRIFSVENAMAIYNAASSQDKDAYLWQDGDHCIYNHSHEKHCLVADWFAARLAAPRHA